MKLPDRFPRIFSSFAAGILLLLLLYWAKCQLGIDIFPRFAWEEHFPVLNVFQKGEYVFDPPPGRAVLLQSNFDEVFPFWPWSAMWVREHATIVDGVVPGGPDGSRCLKVHSDSFWDWSLAHHLIIKARPGRRFILSGYVRTEGRAVARAGIMLYDADGNIHNWVNVADNIQSRFWKKFSGEFVVPPGVTGIRCRLAGYRSGDFYFDDIRFIQQ